MSDVDDVLEVLDEDPWQPFAEGKAACPVCGDHIPVPVLALMAVDDEGRQCLHTKPVMTELWAHMWSHEEVAGRGE